MIRLALFILALAVPAQAEQVRDRSVPMSVQADLEIERYLGTWYEIARFPNWFERRCTGVTAQYATLPDGEISVTNTCYKGSLEGRKTVANGTARVEGPGQLSVTFTPWLPFARGAYWVLHLEPDYSVAVVGSPKGRTGWILARDPQISAEKRARADVALVRNGYDISKLEDVLQR